MEKQGFFSLSIITFSYFFSISSLCCLVFLIMDRFIAFVFYGIHFFYCCLVAPSLFFFQIGDIFYVPCRLISFISFSIICELLFSYLVIFHCFFFILDYSSFSNFTSFSCLSFHIYILFFLLFLRFYFTFDHILVHSLIYSFIHFYIPSFLSFLLSYNWSYTCAFFRCYSF